MNKPQKKESMMSGGNIAIAQAPPKRSIKNDGADFINLILKTLVNNKELKEVVRKNGNSYTLYDDDTDTERGVYKDRKTAWRQQRIYRKANSARKKLARAEKKNDKKMFKDKNVEKQSAQKKPSTAKKENFDIQKAKNLIKESVLTYMFEGPEDNDSTHWDNLLSKFSKETVMSDPKLKNMLTDIAKAEVQTLVKAFNILRKNSELDIKGKKPEMNGETNELELPFSVTLKNSGAELQFSIRIENGKPIINIPDEVRDQLNQMSDPEAKLLRAELISVQEKEFNGLDDVAKTSAKRDAYLKKIENELNKDMGKMSAIELIILKDLLKSKFKAIK